MKSDKLSYRPDIDGLRAVAVLAVVFHHIWPVHITGGYVGVDVFFVISGYLITGIILKELRNGSFSFTNFYLRRVRRLLPALFVMLFVSLAIGWFLLLPSDYAGALRGALGTVFLGSNFVFWQDLQRGYFAGDAKLNPLLHTWSLGVEEQFYLIFPFVFLFLFKAVRRNLSWLMLLALASSLTVSAILIKSHEVAVFFLSPFRAWEFLVGALLAYASLPAAKNRYVTEGVAFFGLLAIVGPIFLYEPDTIFPGFSAVLPVLGAAAVIYAGSQMATVTNFLSSRYIVFFGLISYSLYLWHWPVVVYARSFSQVDLSQAHLFGLLLLSLLLAWLSWKFIEQPFRSPQRATRRVYSYLSVAMAASLIVSISLVGIFGNGYSDRFSPEVVAFDQARSPDIPYRDCGVKDHCILGDADSPPRYVFWGDSHMLAWAPGVDKFLRELGAAGYLYYNSGCPPLLDASLLPSNACLRLNEAVFRTVLERPGVKTVFLSSRWGQYFSDSEWVRGSRTTEQPLVEDSLRSLISDLNKDGVRVGLIGPVPEYRADVPMNLAQHSAFGHEPLMQTRSDYYESHSGFYALIGRLNESDVSFGLSDPALAMCSPICETISNQHPLYRDAHHLSVAGAFEFAEQVFSPYLIGDTVVTKLEKIENH